MTDPDSRLLKAKYVQGYNAQLVTKERQIVIAADLTTEPGDFGHWSRCSRPPSANSQRPG